MKNERTFETIVGVFVLLVSVWFFQYVYNKSKWSDVNAYLISAHFSRADGLSEGVDVKISGVPVGKITKITLQDFIAVVTFTVDKSIALPKDTTAKVASDGLFGGKYMSLDPGIEEQTLKGGDSIKRTISAINIESLIGKFLFSKDEKKS